MNAIWVVLAFAALLGSAQIATGQETPATLRADVQTLVQGNNEFALDLYSQLSQQKGNKLFSPFSISTALGMTFAGARGNTAKEMAQTLHFTLDDKQLHPAFGEVIRMIGRPEVRSYDLVVANSLWGDKIGLTLDPHFQQTAQTDYQSAFRSVDFASDPELARRTINDWVEHKTAKKIQELFPKNLITNDTRLVLVNAIYFKGEWAVPFPKAATKPVDFAVAGVPTFKVSMMSNTFPVNYSEQPDFQMAQLMYRNDKVSMVVILPKKKDGLSDVEMSLSVAALSHALKEARPTNLQVAMPKFKMTGEFSLPHDLKKLGMKDAFVPGAANFTGIESNVKSNSLFISAVVHKAFVEVDEKGTEAAAATGVEVSRTEPVAFHMDHPFLFLIRHNDTGAILFMARVLDPRNS